MAASSRRRVLHVQACNRQANNGAAVVLVLVCVLTVNFAPSSKINAIKPRPSPPAGKWPTALVVRNVPRPSAFSLLEPPCLWGAVAARDLKSSMVSVRALFSARAARESRRRGRAYLSAVSPADRLLCVVAQVHDQDLGIGFLIPIEAWCVQDRTTQAGEIRDTASLACSLARLLLLLLLWLTAARPPMPGRPLQGTTAACA